MKHTVELKDDGNIHVAIIGDGDAIVAQEFVDAVNKIFDANESKKFNAIVDLSNSGDADLDAIHTYRDFLVDERLGKIAFVNASITVKALVKMVIKKKNSEEVKFFENEEEVKSWLSA